MFRALLLALAFVPRLAIADPEIQLEVEPSPGGPMARATIRGLPSTTARVELRVGKVTEKVTEKATVVKSYATAGEPLALAIVFSGQEIWIGNDKFEDPGDPGYYPGALEALVATFDRLQLGKRFPAGSSGTLISYADRVAVRAPMGPLDRLTGSAFGTQRDYYKQVGASLVDGIEASLTALSGTSASRKVLIVIGDGNDTNNGAAKGRLRELRAIASKANIETRAVIHRSALSDPLNVVSEMIPDAIEVASASALGGVIESVIGNLDDRFYAWFPADRMPWDGLPHPAMIRIGAKDFDAGVITFPTAGAAPPDTRWRWRLLGALIAVLGIGGLAIGWRAIRASSRES
ncbi:MAG: hypothetical protein WKG01_17215 [Kofleriaceae bacterium]